MENLPKKKRKLSKKIKNSVRKYSDPIPADLLIDIFSRVHAKSIARFRCVSKLWRSMLKRPDFTELFLTRSLTRPPQFLFSFQVDKELFFFSAPQEPNSDEFSSVVATRYSTSFPKYLPTGYQTMPSGLVLLRGYWAGKRVICNPATGESINLPKLLMKDEKLRAKVERICFGYEPIRKQFKVLCMTSSNTHWILTLGTRKCLWRTVDSKFCFSANRKIEGKICIIGVLYFATRLQESTKIVCFDVGSEEFSLVNIDTNMLNLMYAIDSTTLVNYKGNLGVYQRIQWKNLDFDLWVLHDAENHKWSKHTYSFPITWNNAFGRHSFLRVVGFMAGTDELVFAPYCLSDPSFYVILYNLESNTFKRVIIQGIEVIKGNNRIKIHTCLDYSENVKLFK